MKNMKVKNQTLFKMIFVLLLLVAMLFSVAGVAFAEGEATAEISIAHISDLHYYPTYMSFKQSDANYENSAFVAKGKKESKMLLESSAVIKKLFADLKEQAPDYLVVSGDLSSDGERAGLIDIANALRKLQNDIRANGKENFQIFVVPGNHDIANNNAKDYSVFEGAQTPAVTRFEFAKIFASLGYPDMTQEQAAEFYLEEELNRGENNKYLPYEVVDSSYIPSTTASNVTVKYKANLTTQDLGVGDLTYIAQVASGEIFAGIDSVLSTTEQVEDTIVLKNEVSGRVEQAVLNWLSKNMQGGQATFSIIHHGVLPHFTLQEQWLPDFLLENWEQTTDVLLAKGVKYNFSGHNHANDIASFVNYSGKTLYDIETGSPISFGASYRKLRLKLNSDKSQDIYSTIKTVEDIDVSLLIEEEFLTKDFNVENWSKWQANDNSIHYFADYVYDKLYAKMVDNVLQGFVLEISKDSFMQKAMQIIESYDGGETATEIIDSYKPAIETMLGNFYDNVQAINLKNYSYKGNYESLKGQENKLRAYVYDFAKAIININVASYKGRNYTLQDMIIEAYTKHLQGCEIDIFAASQQWFVDGMQNLLNGNVIEDIFAVAQNNNGIVPLVKNVLKTDYNLSAGIEANIIKELNSVLGLFDVKVEKLNLDKLIKNLFENDLNVVPSAKIDNIIANYTAKNITQGIGGKLGEVLISLATDSSYDGMLDIESLVLYDKDDAHSQFNGGKTRKATIQDGRIPSMLTVSFGEDVATSKNFVWFTDKRVTGTTIEYAEGDFSTWKDAKKTKVNGATEIYAVDFPLADIGVISTFKTKELARHSVKLAELKPNTKYCYRVGDNGKNWWSGLFTFTTAPQDQNTPFESLLVTDLQGMTEDSYFASNELLKASERVFSEEGYSFILNLGDIVDNGRNLNQWTYALNSARAIYGNTTQIMVAGNHENQVFKPSAGYTPTNDKVNVSGYKPLDLHYNFGAAKNEGMYYSFDYSGVHFVVLDTNDIVNDTLNYTQVEWLIADLKNAKDKKTIVAMHKGIYTTGPHATDKEIVNMRKTLTPIFSGNGVELVLQGHDHVYSESFFINEKGEQIGNAYKHGAPINNNNGGVLYVSLGSAGNKFYNYAKNDNIPINYGKQTLDKPTFGKLHFDGENISYYGFEYDLKADKIIELTKFNDKVIKSILSIAAVTIIGLILIGVIFAFYRSNKRKIEKYKKEEF